MSEIKIGLTGKMRAGKDTVADYLVENYGFTKFAFANALKRYVHEIFEVSEDAKPRDIYQRFGQYCRAIDEDVWVRKCFEDISFCRELPLTHLVRGERELRPVITDIRQPNEYARCRAEGFVLIRVVADDNVRLERAREAGDVFDADTLNHETERYVDGFDVDFEVENNGAWRSMAEQVDVIMRELSGYY